MPNVVYDHVINSKIEKISRIFATVTIFSTIYFTTYGLGAEYLRQFLAVHAISPFFLIDLRRLRPWQYFSIFSALSTFILLYEAA